MGIEVKLILSNQSIVFFNSQALAS